MLLQVGSSSILLLVLLIWNCFGTLRLKHHVKRVSLWLDVIFPGHRLQLWAQLLVEFVLAFVSHALELLLFSNFVRSMPCQPLGSRVGEFAAVLLGEDYLLDDGICFFLHFFILTLLLICLQWYFNFIVVFRFWYNLFILFKSPFINVMLASIAIRLQ